MSKNLVAIIGGSGVKDGPMFDGAEWKRHHANFSNGFAAGQVEYQERDGVTFIPRHGNAKRFGPSKTQYAANLIIAKELGARVVIATSAVGSLHGNRIGVESLVVPDDFIDESGRNDNLYGEGLVVHTSPIPPFSEQLRVILLSQAGSPGECFSKIHDKGVYVVIPGDRFGTKAEGKRRGQYADIVGMTIAPEAAIALQLGLHYAVAAFPVDTNIDANHEGGTEEVMRRLSAPERVPAYMERVVDEAKKFAPSAPLLPQLQGNIIPGDVSSLENRFLRKFGQELMDTYCDRAA